MAEKKTTKKKTTVKTNNEVVAEQVASCNCDNDYIEYLLGKIFYALIILIIISALTLVTIVVKGGGITISKDSTSDEKQTQTQEEETGEYDVSMFETLNTTDTLSKLEDGSKYVIYIGRSTCGYCVKFLPVLQQAQSEYGYKTIYINLEEMSSTDQDNIKKIDKDGYINENLGYTPMVLVVENNQLKEGWVGYSEYDSFAEYLERNGYSKK